mmetsp:Transcript_1495/g.2207  ORF Transcript_1495/g.2207 Transcript_1495/m.2207 type:complete len:112 (-) Transcript_1495:1439-1774(-)
MNRYENNYKLQLIYTASNTYLDIIALPQRNHQSSPHPSSADSVGLPAFPSTLTPVDSELGDARWAGVCCICSCNCFNSCFNEATRFLALSSSFTSKLIFSSFSLVATSSRD